jgi:hypothetical protein
MPAQERVGLDEQHRLPPSADAASQEHEQRAVGRRAARALGAPSQDDALLPEEGILGVER